MSVKFFARCVHVYACMKCVTRKGVNYRQIVFVCRGVVGTFLSVAVSNVLSHVCNVFMSSLSSSLYICVN